MTSTASRMPAMKWSHGLICGAALAWLPGYSLLIGVLLFPLLLVSFTGLIKDQSVVRIMLPYGFAALVHPLHMLWLEDGSFDAAVNLLLDPMTSVVAWGAAAAGWFVLEVSLMGAKLLRYYQVKSRKASVAGRLKALKEEWAETPDPAAPVA